MSGPLFFTSNEIYMAKMENDIVIPSKPIFHSWFVEEIYSRKKIGDNVLFNNRLNNYHLKIKITIELNSSKFLDTKLTNIDGFYKFNVHRKSTKLPSPWTSKTTKRYKRKTVNDNLHRPNRISPNFDEKIPLIKREVYEG